MEIKQPIIEQPMSQRINQKGNKKNLETNENDNITYQNLWYSKSSDKRKVYSNNIYIMKKDSNTTLNHKELEKEEQIKPKVSRKKGIM